MEKTQIELLITNVLGVEYTEETAKNELQVKKSIPELENNMIALIERAKAKVNCRSGNYPKQSLK